MPRISRPSMRPSPVWLAKVTSKSRSSPVTHRIRVRVRASPSLASPTPGRVPRAKSSESIGVDEVGERRAPAVSALTPRIRSTLGLDVAGPVGVPDDHQLARDGEQLRPSIGRADDRAGSASARRRARRSSGSSSRFCRCMSNVREAAVGGTEPDGDPALGLATGAERVGTPRTRSSWSSGWTMASRSARRTRSRDTR